MLLIFLGGVLRNIKIFYITHFFLFLAGGAFRGLFLRRDLSNIRKSLMMSSKSSEKKNYKNMNFLIQIECF